MYLEYSPTIAAVWESLGGSAFGRETSFCTNHQFIGSKHLADYDSHGVVVSRVFHLTLSRYSHGGAIASREVGLVCKDPSDAVAGCSCSSNGETQCHD